MTTRALTSLGETSGENYLSPGQLLIFQERLLTWHRDVTRQLQTPTESGLAEPMADWVDSASSITQSELSRVDRERLVQTIREIDAALSRIREGTYGYCEETGEEIGPARLMAMPIARLSIDAQRDRERRRRICC